MASYAPVGGSVGPHFDYYDVFLLQAWGERNWRIGQWCDKSSPTLPDTVLKILEEFMPSEDWTLSPGDMLYLPPRLAHFGVAQNDCITLSIGFRAPTHKQVLDDFTHFLCADEDTGVFYNDPDLEVPANPGLISDAALSRIDAILRRHLLDPHKRNQWFIQYTTEPKNVATLGEHDENFCENDLLSLLESGENLRQNEGSRFAYIVEANHILLGVDGKSYTLPSECLQNVIYLCENQSLDLQQLFENNDNTAMFALITSLVQEGSLYC